MNATTWLEGLTTQDGLRALGTRLPQLVTGALALALAVQAAIIVADLAGGARHPSPALPGNDLNSPASRGSRVDIAGLVNSHLFGAAPVAAASGSGADAPATSLALVLAGVLAAEDPYKGMAIIGEAVTNARVYSVGQNVPGGAKLHAVYDDRVVLDRNGSLEALMLPRQGGAARAAPPVVASQGNPALERMRRMITEQPEIVGEVLRPQPVFAGGKQRGYRVYPGRNHAAFSHLGLVAGDLVTSINGTPLDDPSRGDEIFHTLGSAAEAHITVMRNGRQQDLLLNLAQVANDTQQAIGVPGPPPGFPPPAPGGPVVPVDQQTPITAPAEANE